MIWVNNGAVMRALPAKGCRGTGMRTTFPAIPPAVIDAVRCDTESGCRGKPDALPGMQRRLIF